MTTADGHSLIGSDPETRRALELDTLAAILPMDRRDRLAELLTDDDVATLTHLARAGMGANTLRALASDLAYLETWAWAALSGPLPWPAPEALILRFVAHHLWDPVQRETDPSHGMPEAVASILRANDQLRVEGPHAPSTVRRRLAHWSTLHRWRGLTGPFGAPNVRQALRLATRAARRPRGRKSERPVTRDVLDQLLATCDAGRPADLRDRALLLVAFASGGRRRSEAASLRVADLIEREPVPADPKTPDGPTLPALSLTPRPDQDGQRRAGRAGAADRPSGRGSAGVAGCCGDPERRRVPRDHPLGPARPHGARSAKRERHSQEALWASRSGSKNVLGPWAALGLPDRGGPARGFAAGGHAPVPPPLGAASLELLQRDRDRTRRVSPPRMISPLPAQGSAGLALTGADIGPKAKPQPDAPTSSAPLR